LSLEEPDLILRDGLEKGALQGIPIVQGNYNQFGSYTNKHDTVAELNLTLSGCWESESVSIFSVSVGSVSKEKQTLIKTSKNVRWWSVLDKKGT